MIKLVLDTNIYISAILFGGKPETIRKLSKEGKITVLISEAILKEITEVLRIKFRFENWQISQTINEIREFTTLITPRKTFFIIKEDPADNRILECAQEGKAQYIISGDKHLLTLKKFQKIEILSPVEFLKLLNE